MQQQARILNLAYGSMDVIPTILCLNVNNVCLEVMAHNVDEILKGRPMHFKIILGPQIYYVSFLNQEDGSHFWLSFVNISLKRRICLFSLICTAPITA